MTGYPTEMMKVDFLMKEVAKLKAEVAKLKAKGQPVKKGKPIKVAA